VHNLDFRPQDEGYTDDLITQHAIEFIRENQTHPFFCYVPFHLVHAPLQAKKDDLAAMDPKVTAGLPAAKADTPAEDKHTHAAMLHALDKEVGDILVELDQLGLRDNTIVVFTSDNGAMQAESSLPLRGPSTPSMKAACVCPRWFIGPKADSPAAGNGRASAARLTCSPP